MTMLMGKLRGLARRGWRIYLVAGLAWGAVAATLGLLVGAWLDLLWELSSQARVAWTGAAIILLALTLLAALTVARRRALPFYLAQRLDRAARTDGKIRAGVELALVPANHSPLTAGLAQLAVEQAGTLAAAVSGPRVVSSRPVSWALASAVGVTLLLLLIAYAMPRLAETQWLRFADPWGDHPPYSRIQFQVEPGDARVVWGSSLHIQARTEGPAVDRLDLVMHGADRPGQEILPMFPVPDGRWRALLSQVDGPAEYHVRAHGSRSRKFHIAVITVPRLVKVHVRVVPPAYTNRPAYEGTVPEGGLSGLPGTQIEVWAKSNRPLAEGTLEFAAKDKLTTLTLKPTSPGSLEVTGTFTLHASGKLQVWVLDQEGQASTDRFATPVTLLHDERPLIRLAEPAARAFATPTAILPVLLTAEDDYGITHLSLYRSLNDSRGLPLPLQLPKLAPLRWSSTTMLPLSSYGLTPGDEIKLFGRVEDNDPAGPNGAESALAVVRIISQEEFENMVLARQTMEMLLSKYQQAQRRLEKAREEVDRLRKKAKADDPEAAKEMRDALAKLGEMLRREAAALEKLAGRKQHFDLEKNMAPALERTARRLKTLADQAQKLAGAKLDAKELRAALDDWWQQLQDQQEELHREVMEPLQELAAVLPLIAQASRFVILYQRQQALAERLHSLKGKDLPAEVAVKARMKNLQAEQETLRKALAELLGEIEDAAAQLEHPDFKELRQEALDFVRKVRASGASQAMEDAEQGLADLSGTRAHAAAQKAADILKQFIDECDQALAGRARLRLGFRPGLAGKLGATIDQMLAAMGLLPGGGGQGTAGSQQDPSALYGAMSGFDEQEPRLQRKQARLGSGKAGDAAVSGVPPPGVNAGPLGGTGDGVAPLIYRRRVAEYFRRIAEETSGNR